MRLFFVLLLLVAVAVPKSSSRGSSNSRASVSTTHSTHTTFSTKTRSKFSHSHSPSTTKKSPSKTESSSLHDTRKHHQSNPTRSQAAPTSRSIELVGSSWGSVTPTSRTIGSARSRGGSAVRSQLAQTDRTSSEISRVPTTKKPGRLQRIKEKLPAITEKLKEKLKPKLPAITAAAKKYGPKIGKMLLNKFREKTTTPRPMTLSTGTAYSTSWRSANMATASPTVLTVTKAADGDEIFIEYNDDFHSECPEEVDAFLQLGNVSFIFEAHHLFLVEDGSLNQTTAISSLFPGVHKVDASVYDANQELILLFKERKVFGFHWNEGHDNFTLADNFPKDLPESIKFTPDGAFTWHDGYPVLVSNSGEFVIYDSHWNKEIDIGKAGEKYLQSLPLDTQGLSDWEDKKAIVFAKAKVYEYDVETKSVVGEEANLSHFFGCYIVDIPSSTRI